MDTNVELSLLILSSSAVELIAEAEVDGGAETVSEIVSTAVNHFASLNKHTQRKLHLEALLNREEKILQHMRAKDTSKLTRKELDQFKSNLQQVERGFAHYVRRFDEEFAAC